MVAALNSFLAFPLMETTLSAKPTYNDLQARVDELEKEITHCRKIQEAIWAERRQLTALLKGFPAYVCMEGPNHTIYYANDFFRERFGDPGGRRCADLFRESIAACPVPGILETMQPRTWDWLEAPGGGAYRVYAYPFAAGQQGEPMVLELGLDVAGRQPADHEYQLVYEELQYTIGKLQRLQRIVPICSCCRQPRNDESHRQQVDAYIRTHADEPFTFGLCPSCREKYFLRLDE
jgi:hypothetical protein